MSVLMPRLNRAERRQYMEAQLLAAAPRLLSSLDRCPVSASGGCLDREYWAWATKDFANADLQRGLLVLAYLYRTPFAGNIYHDQTALLGWIGAGVRFWIRSQSRQGAFDHLYAHENSWMAAAFTLTDLAETFEMVGAAVAPVLRKDWLGAMERAGRFLVRHDETHGFISNHRAGAAAGLFRLAALTGASGFERRAWGLLESVYARQSLEGWFLEYEGADPGYQTLDTHYQALCYQAVRREAERKRILAAITSSLDFLAWFIHPDGSLGGEYGSRNCPHFFPGGFEVFAREIPLAESIAQAGVAGLASGHSCGLADADPRNMAPMAASYVLAHQALTRLEEPAVGVLPLQRRAERLWSEAGMYIRSDERMFVVVGGSKGGVVKIFSRRPAAGALLYSSSGYTGRTRSGAEITTLLWTSLPTIKCSAPAPNPNAENCPTRTISVKSQFYRFHSHRLMSSGVLVLLRLFSLTLGRFRPLHAWWRKYGVIRRFLTARQAYPVWLQRQIHIHGDTVDIQDEITWDPRVRLVALQEHSAFAAVYMASARYFRRQDLNHIRSSENLIGSSHASAVNRTRSIKVNATANRIEASHVHPNTATPN